MIRFLIPAVIIALLCPAASAQSVVELLLIDADSDAVLDTLVDGQTVVVADYATSEFNIQAITQPTTVGSVQFFVGGDLERTENSAPYAFQGDFGGDFIGWSPPQGTLDLSVVAYSEGDGGGTSSVPLQVSVTFDYGGSPPPGSGDGTLQVDAGPDLFPLVGPVVPITISGTAETSEGTVDAFEWTQIGGPMLSTSGAATDTLIVTGAVPGEIYRFRLTATSSTGEVAADDVLVMINPGVAPPAVVTGELLTWHPVTLSFSGPSVSETDTPNPSLDYGLEVVFTQGDRSLRVPGFYAADGNAAESGANTGNQWRALFAPDATGVWTYTALFRVGPEVAIAVDLNPGDKDLSIHGSTGTFSVMPTDKSAPDLRARGVLRHNGTRLLHFADGTPYLKGGADSPENLLAYEDFDSTYDLAGGFLHAYAPHLGDWQPGGPQWQGGRGRGLIGALNYLAGEGMNCVYFLTCSLEGDGQDLWPWITPADSDRLRYDVSKLAQWEIVFRHMTAKGIVLHVITQETENDQLLDGGALGDERRLYYRELIARFGHHPGIIWNLGEENTNTEAQRRAFAQYFEDLDAYDHPVTIHTFPGAQQNVWGPLMGLSTFEAGSLQSSIEDVHPKTLTWIANSEAAGRPWVIFSDEIGPASDGAVPDSVDPDHDSIRHEVLWGNLMAGGGGVEWYFGYQHAHHDLTCEDWRSRDALWKQTAHALDFFQSYVPVDELFADDGLTSDANDYAMSHPLATHFVIYRPNGGTTSASLPEGEYELAWFDPRSGGVPVPAGSLSSDGATSVSIGPAPSSDDWVALITALPGAPGPRVIFERGDVNQDGDVNIADPITEIAILFQGEAPPTCSKVRDANDDGSIDIGDVIFLLQALLDPMSPPIPPPTGECAEDPTEDLLPCGPPACPG